MPTIRFQLSRELILNQGDENLNLELELKHFRNAPIINIDTQEKILSVSANFTCRKLTPDNLLKLSASREYRLDNLEMLKEYKNIITQLQDTAYEIDLLLRKELDRLLNKSLLGNTIDTVFLHPEAEKWVSSNDIPTYKSTLSITKSNSINQDFASKFKALIEDKEEPMIAYHFLDIASSTNDPKIKWVVGTIALEVAIKEAIISIDGRLEVLFNEIPSPPLRKLYKHVLKSLTGYESPFYNDIQKGSTIRNKIVHKPSKIVIEAQDAVNYLSMINIALDHLTYLVRCIKNDLEPDRKFHKYSEIKFSNYL